MSGSEAGPVEGSVISAEAVRQLRATVRSVPDGAPSSAAILAGAVTQPVALAGQEAGMAGRNGSNEHAVGPHAATGEPAWDHLPALQRRVINSLAETEGFTEVLAPRPRAAAPAAPQPVMADLAVPSAAPASASSAMPPEIVAPAAPGAVPQQAEEAALQAERQNAAPARANRPASAPAAEEAAQPVQPTPAGTPDDRTEPVPPVRAEPQEADEAAPARADRPASAPAVEEAAQPVRPTPAGTPDDRTEPVPPARADAPHVQASDVAGPEDGAIALDLAAALTDLDGSETLSVAILGVPEGATLSAGTRQADGSWTVAPSKLAGPMLTPPVDFAGTIALTLRATATESANGDTAIRETGFSVHVAPRAEAAAMLVLGGSGEEDCWITIAASFVTPDGDGSERLASIAQVTGLPAGAVLNGGVETAPGSWTVPSEDLLAGRIAVRPPADSNGDLRLTITATLVDSAGGTTDSRTLITVAEIGVAARADAPLAAAADANGQEDRAVALGLSATLADRDGSETLSVAILGMPEGAALSAGTRQPDGSWVMAPASLAGLSLTPPPNFAGDIRLTLRATATEAANGDTTIAEQPFTVHVAAAVDGSDLSATAAGREDTAIAIRAEFGSSPDPSEAWDTTAVIHGVPEGATLSQGTPLGGGAWRVDHAELAAGRVAITPPADSDASIALTIEACIIDRDGAGASRDVMAPFTVQVQAVADAPLAHAGNVTGAEDRAIALDLSAALADRDGSETLSVSLLGLPTGATLSAGTRQADGSWRLAVADLPGLALTPPRDFAGELRLTLFTTATEARGGSTATTTVDFTVHVEARADAANIAAGGEGAEDSWIFIRGTLAITDLDGSEQLGDSITVSNVPSGAMLSHGTQISPGTWSVPRSLFEAGELAIRPPANGDADITLRISAQTIDGASIANTEANATIVVRAVADAPTVQVADIAGTEDTAIRLAGLGGALIDTDGSEALGFVLTGVPSTASLTAGTRQADGSWVLTPAQLATVSLRPPANFSGGINLTLTAVATEARDGAPQARTSASFRVGVNPVADSGTISGDVTGNEDTVIVVRPTFSTPDGDGSESWSTTSTVSGVPVGATLSQGTLVSPGVWEVQTTELRAGRVTITPPANRDADFTLTIRAMLIDTGNGTSVSRQVTGSHAVTVRGVADAPVVTVTDVAELEDQPIALQVGARLADLDGSERLGVVISGVPAGAALSAGTRNADGSWTVPPADLPGLSLTPPRDFSGTINLVLRATATDNDSSNATTMASFAVRVDAVADAAALRVGPAIEWEDEAIALRVSGATTDVDGSERLVGFRLLDVPEGATMRAGGSALARLADGSFLVEAAAAPTLSITPPRDSDHDFTLRVTAISEEPNGNRAESPARDLSVRVEAVSDAPVWLRIGAEGQEDGAIPLGLAARLADADGSEALSFLVSGLPAGAVLSHGTYRGPGSWSLTPEEATAVSVIPPRDFAGTLNLTVTAVAQERDGGSQTTSTVSFPVRVTAVVDNNGWTAAARGAEDSAIALNLTPPLRDADGSERLVGTALVEGVPAGAVLRLGNGSVAAGSGGSFHIPVDRLAGATLTMPRDSDVAAELHVTVTVEDAGGVRSEIRGTVTVDPAGVADRPALRVFGVALAGHGSNDPAQGWVTLPVEVAVADTDGSETAHVWIRDLPEGFTLSAGTPAGDGAWLLREGELAGLQLRPPAGYAGTAELRIQAVAVEREGDSTTAGTTLTVHIAPAYGSGGPAPLAATVPPPVLAVSDQAGTEDVAAPLQITAGAAPGASLGLMIAGVPASARLSAGLYDPERDVWILRPEELDGLKVIPAADAAGEVTLRVTAVAVGPAGGTTLTEARMTVHLEAVADGAAVSVAPDAALEDQEIPLNLRVGAADADGSERVVAVTLSGLPRGARIASAEGVHDNGDGTWSVAPEAVGRVRFVPPAEAHGIFSLTVTATTREASNGATATTSHGVSVAVAPVPDAPVAAAADAAGREDQPIPLALSAALMDRDSSESLSVVISGLPEGAWLSAGVNNGDGSWTLTAGQLPGLSVTAPKDWSGSMVLTMQAHAMERATGEVATTAVQFRVAVAGAADAPLVDVATAARGAEDRPVALDLIARLTDTDGSEALVLVVTGVPSGASFSAGATNPDGSWSIPGSALPTLTFTPPPNYAGTLRLDFAATAQEADGDSAATRFQVAVTVDPVVDAPVLAFTGIQGAEDMAIRLAIAATLADADGSESIARYVVSGLPSGASLSAGIRGADGAWTLTPDQAASVTLTPPANWSGSLNLSVTAVAREGATGAEASSTTVLPITVTSLADAPVLSAVNATGEEDNSVALGLSAALADTDGSESFAAIRIGGLPEGFSLSAGTPAGGGEWALRPADLAGLRLTPPSNWNGTISLTLTATAQDGASTTTTSRGFTVSLAAVNDAPVLALGAPHSASVGQDRAAAVSEVHVTDVDSTRIGRATISLSGAQSGDRLVFDGFETRQVGGRTMVGDTGLEVTQAADGSLTLTGAAPLGTYERLIGALALETGAQDGLASGVRSIGITLRDEAGALAATQIVALAVDPSVIHGGSADASLAGTAGHDTFIGGAGSESMTGGAGADLFIAAMGGGHDSVDGGTGAWTDTVRVTGAGAPGQGGWTLIVDGGTAVTATDQTFDFAQPASGHIQLADGSELEFRNIERVTW